MLLKRIVLIAAIVIVVLACGVIGYGEGRYRMRRDLVHAVGPAPARVEHDAATRERGDHLAHTAGGCTVCHGEDLGGQLLAEDALFRVVAPNLTRGAGSAVAGFSDADWFHAIRDGVHPDGRSLLVMPAKDLGLLAHADLAALLAYLEGARAVARELPRAEASFFGGVMVGLLGLPVFSAEEVDHHASHPTTPLPAGPTAHYGRYLTQVCTGCHGTDFRGGKPPHP